MTRSDDALPHVRVLIVDKLPAFRLSVAELIERRGYQVTGEAGTAARALELVALLEPDALLIDIGLPDENGFDLSARLTAAQPSVAVLLTSEGFDDAYYELARKNGARGFVLKSLLPRTQLSRFWPSPHGQRRFRPGLSRS